jgi:hypothetical protein
MRGTESAELAEERNKIGHIYYMGCVDLLDLIRKRLATIGLPR